MVQNIFTYCSDDYFNYFRKMYHFYPYNLSYSFAIAKNILLD